MFQATRGVDGVTIRDEIGCGVAAPMPLEQPVMRTEVGAHYRASGPVTPRSLWHPWVPAPGRPENGDANTYPAGYCGDWGSDPALVMSRITVRGLRRSAGVDGLLGVHRVAQWAAHQEPHPPRWDQRSADIGGRSGDLPDAVEEDGVARDPQCAVGFACSRRAQIRPHYRLSVGYPMAHVAGSGGDPIAGRPGSR